MDSIFLLDDKGEVIMERHSLGGAFTNKRRNRRILERFKEELNKVNEEGNVPLPVIPTPELAPDFASILCSERSGVYLISPIGRDIEPLLLMEFILKIWETFESYFGAISERAFKSNFVVVQYLLDEMLDNGRPFVTERNVLTELIYPPDFINRMINIELPFKAILAPDVPPGLFTNTPWRKKGARYVANEIFVDIVEEVDCTMDCNAYIDRCEIWGEVRVDCRLSGMPKLEIEFNHPELLFDVSFHPSVNLNIFNRDRILSFVPPDGKFVLMNYRVKGQIHPPVLVRPKYDRSKAVISVELKGDATFVTILTIPWDADLSSAATTVTKGNLEVNNVLEEAKWLLGTLDKPEPQKGILHSKATLESSVPRDASTNLLANNPIRVDFSMKSALSGLKIESLSIENGLEGANKAFKGLKTTTKAGNYYVQPNSLTSGVMLPT